jgi:hypothetical protein
MTTLAVYKTPQELRAQVRAKLPPMLAKEEAEARRMGLETLPITTDVVDYELPLTCIHIVMVCPAFPFFEEECERLDEEGEPGTDTAESLEYVREQWPAEIASCNLLVQEVVAAGKAKHLRGQKLLDFIYEGMKPFTMGEEGQYTSL